MHMRKFIFIGLLVLLALVVAGCAGPAGEPGEAGPAGPAGPEGPQGPPGPAPVAADLSCTACHNATTLITGKQTAWSESLHGSGETYVRGTSSRCAGCHSGSGFTERIALGQHPGELEVGDPDPTRQDCRTCRQIHTSYTSEDWALTTTGPVELYVLDGVTFDGGEGNLCANCHQPAFESFGEAVDGMVEVTSTHWGPHHGPQSAMLLGAAGAGDVEGKPSGQATMVQDTCVGCHMSEGDDHTFESSVAACTACHADAEDFDINGVQTEVQAMLDELEEDLIAKGWLDEEGHPAVDFIPEGEAAALWNWIYIAHEDKSLGVHNPAYTKALLEASLESMK